MQLEDTWFPETQARLSTMSLHGTLKNSIDMAGDIMTCIDARIEGYLFVLLYTENDLRQLAVNCFLQVSMSITAGLHINI